MKLEYTVKTNEYINIKQILKEKFNMSDRLILKLKKSKKIILNNEITYINKAVFPNDKLEISIDFIEDNSNIVPTKMNLDIIYEDDSMLVLNKPSGIPVHPSMSYYDNSLSNGVRFYFDNIRFKKENTTCK